MLHCCSCASWLLWLCIVSPELRIFVDLQVNIGKIHWVSPIGLLGCAPLVSIGPVELGPGPIEKTSATVSAQACSPVFHAECHSSQPT